MTATRRTTKTKPARKKVVMPPIGAHMSIAGGLHLALERGRELGCDIIQLFTKSASQWAARPLSDMDVDQWHRARETSGVQPVLAHDSYLINLATPDDKLFRKSVEAFAVELARCALLRIPNLVMHPGAHMGSGEATAIKRVCQGLDQALDLASAEEDKAWKQSGDAGDVFRTTVLVEATAGQGTCMGYRFEHLRDILAGVGNPRRYGLCFDTCHVFAAGYDLRDADGFAATMDEFDGIVGLQHIRAFHLNDSKKPCGSRVDRHEHIGRGEIGRGAFRALLTDPRFRDQPMSLETPKEDAGDKKNLALLRRLARS